MAALTLWRTLPLTTIFMLAGLAGAEAQSTFSKSPTGAARIVAATATPSQREAANAQTKCVELIKAQSAFERSIAGMSENTRTLEAKMRALPQNASLSSNADKCSTQKSQIESYKETAGEHLNYLDNLAEAIKNCPSQMTERLAGAQLAIKKSHEVLEKVAIATEGAFAASCK